MFWEQQLLSAIINIKIKHSYDKRDRGFPKMEITAAMFLIGEVNIVFSILGSNIQLFLLL